MIKKRILFTTEFTALSTGYASYYRNLMKELSKDDSLTIFELASYCHPQQHAQQIAQTPWKIYGNLPTTPEEEQYYNSHPTNEFSAWKLEQVCLDCFPHIVASIRDSWMDQFIDQSPFRKYYKTVFMPTVDACFIAGTPIIGKSVVKNIENVKDGDLVVSHDGSINKVVKTYEREYSGNMVTISCNGPVLPITLTEDHPVLAVKYKGQKWTHDNRLHRSVNHCFNDAEFISAKDVESGDYLIVPNSNTFNNVTEINILDYLYDIPVCLFKNRVYGTVDVRSRGLDLKLQIDTNLAGLLGLFVAEGYTRTDGNCGQICMCQSKEQEYLDFAQKQLEDIFDVKTRRYPSKKTDGEIVAFTGKILCTFLKNSCGRVAEEKKIPDFILNSNQEIAIAFLEKLFIGDGCDTNGPHENRVISYCTVSRTLAYQVSRLLLQFGVLSSVSVRHNHQYERIQPAYDITIFNYHGSKLAKLFDWENPNFSFSEYNNTKSWIDEDTGHALVRVSGIDNFSSVDPIKVYNLEVENKNSYCVGFSVHNCDQNPEWLDFYKRSDHILTYTGWSKNVLDKEGGGLINTVGVGNCAVNSEVFQFIPNKAEHKQRMGIRPDTFIIGMVARNQKRKLYPELAKTFVEFLQKLDHEGTENVFLYWHTCYPDLGFAIPDLILNNGLSHKVLFTYNCMQCKHYFPSFYRDVRTACPRCRSGNVVMANSQSGVSESELSSIYNLFDIFVQYSSNEGLGIPTLEAAMCGVIVAGTNYSAMEETIPKLNGYLIDPDKEFVEVETGRKMVFPNNNQLVDVINKVRNLPESVRNAKRAETRALAVKHYGSWKKVAENWKVALDKVTPDDNIWSSPPNIINMPPQMPQECNQMSEEQFVSWLFINCLGEPRLVNSYIGLTVYKNLIWGRVNTNNLGLFSNDMSLLGGRPSWRGFTREDAYNQIRSYRENANRWEMARHQKIQTMRTQ